MDQVLQTRLLYVGGSVVLSAALAGMITGTRPPQARPPTATPENDVVVESAASYSELRDARRGPNGSMYKGVFAWLASLPHDLRDPETQTSLDRSQALAERAARRAYAGAPPVIPHAVLDREANACLACHETGAAIGKLQAPAMSHKKLTMCTQCHAVAADTAPLMVLAEVGGPNEFEGASEPGQGSRAWENAPPSIPHAVLMRENCASCHGPRGRFGLRTPHPAQVSCQQCHAASADFDQSAPPSMPTVPPRVLDPKQ